MSENLIEQLPDRLEKELASILQPDETVHVKLKGAFKEGLVCTDARVIILKGGFMAGQVLGNNVFQQPYSMLAGVQIKKHFMTGYLEVNAGGMQNTPKSYWSSDKQSDPAKAPNCISINQKQQFARFQLAATFITERSNAARSSGATTAPAPGPVDTVEALERLAKLRDSGVLTDEEFAAQKAKLLS